MTKMGIEDARATYPVRIRRRGSHIGIRIGRPHQGQCPRCVAYRAPAVTREQRYSDTTSKHPTFATTRLYVWFFAHSGPLYAKDPDRCLEHRPRMRLSFRVLLLCITQLIDQYIHPFVAADIVKQCFFCAINLKRVY